MQNTKGQFHLMAALICELALTVNLMGIDFENAEMKGYTYQIMILSN